LAADWNLVPYTIGGSALVARPFAEWLVLMKHQSDRGMRSSLFFSFEHIYTLIHSLLVTQILKAKKQMMQQAFYLTASIEMLQYPNFTTFDTGQSQSILRSAFNLLCRMPIQQKSFSSV
jgi:hypothetical protein